MRICCYPVYTCRLEALPNHDLCRRHVRLDPNTHYQQCAFKISEQISVGTADALTSRDHTYACPNAVSHTGPGESFCADHANELLSRYQDRIDDGLRRSGNREAAIVDKLASVDRVKSASDFPCWGTSLESAATVLLEQYATTTVNSVVNDCDGDKHSLSSFDPVLAHMDVEDVWWGEDGGESDPESVDSEADDVLKYAGVYTAEEFVRLMREKLIRLQKLYIDQFQQLHRELADEIRIFRQRSVVESLRRFSKVNSKPSMNNNSSVRRMVTSDEHSKKRKSSDIGGADMNYQTVHDLIANPPPSGDSWSTSSQKDWAILVDSYKRLCALNHYSRPHGCEVLLQQMLDDKRRTLTTATLCGTTNKRLLSGTTKTSGVALDCSVSLGSHSSSSEQQSKVTDASSPTAFDHASNHQDVVPCVFSLSTHVRCGLPSLPLSRHCYKHILSDSLQVLFRPCGAGDRHSSPSDIPNASGVVSDGRPSVPGARSAVGPGGDSVTTGLSDFSSSSSAIDICPNPVVNFVDPSPKRRTSNGTDGSDLSSADPASRPMEINRCVYHTLLPQSTCKLILG